MPIKLVFWTYAEIWDSMLLLTVICYMHACFRGHFTCRTAYRENHWFSFPPKSIIHLFAMYVSSRMPNILKICADVGSLELLILQIVVIIISQFLLNFFHAFCVTAWLLSVIWSILFATLWCHWNFRFKMGDILHTVKGDHGGYKVVMNTVTMYIIHMYLN